MEKAFSWVVRTGYGHRSQAVEAPGDYLDTAACWDEASVHSGTYLRERIMDNGTPIILRSQ